ncbi:DUF4401 domain-containing protein [Xanthobacter autotrophicus]|uniref:DUF4401 domain-containing protein n=1 Tax=Xanthobacter TaxID=279 RepID=UPI0024AB59F7|nr:DUF4401 domain-containing protein [Xanthobacter autotrophicus]MDI4662756.1 DUF4401 domain-containing protein [Xanthobacter autotrophicus]
MTRPSIDAATLINAWQASGVLPPDAHAAVVEAVLASAAEERPPLYLKILSAVGTLLATLFFLAFLFVADIISLKSGSSLLGWGLAFLAAGIGLSLVLPRIAEGIGRSVLAQTAFTAMALGKVMSVFGVVLLAGTDTPWVPTAAIAAVTIATYPVSASSLDRVLSPYAVAASALAEILGRSTFNTDPSLLLAAFYGMATAVAGLLILVHRVPLALRPIGIAALAAMGTIVCILASGHDAGLWANRHPLDPRPIETILTLSLIGTLAWVAGGVGRLAEPPLAAAAAGIVLLGLAGAPGVSFALLVLIVGHALHDVPLRVVGVLALPVFLVLWYYGRDLSFLEKSATLVGSGLLLLGGQFVIARAGWDREETP